MHDIINTLGPIFKWIALVLLLLTIVLVIIGKKRIDSLKLNYALVLGVIGVVLLIIITFVIILF